MVDLKNRKIIGIGVLLISVFMLGSCGSRDAQEVPVGKVQRGTFYIDIYEEGEIEAVNSTHIVAPLIPWRYASNLKINQIVKDGAEVNAGDTVAVFDQAEVLKSIVDAESRLEINLAELEKLNAQHQSELEELNADYKVTEISLEISEIKFEQASYDSEMAKREIKLNLEKAGISLERAKEQIENRKKIQQEEIKQKNLAIEQARTSLREANESLARLFLISPSPGIAIIAHNWSTNNKFQVGDQCWVGQALIQLPDLNKLKAKININEVDIAKIEKGQEVEIKPDAFSESVFSGTVHSVANLAVNKEGSNKIKVFPVEIYLNETHENLLPGLTVSCRVIIDKIDDVLYVPLDALRVDEDGETEFVYRKTAGGYDRTEVETGARNSDYVVILKGIGEGDNIALADPFAERSTSDGDTEATSN